MSTSTMRAETNLCPAGWTLRWDYLTARYDRELPWILWTNHKDTCLHCKAYFKALNEAARAAKHPELSESEMEAI